MATDNVDDDETKKEIEEEPQIKVDTLSVQQKLYYYCKQGDIEGIKSVKSSIDINATDTEGINKDPFCVQNCALHYAVESGSLECVKAVYALEAMLDVTNKFKSTPLHIAAALGFAEIVDFLLEMKATIDPKNLIQNTPLHCAVYAGHVEAVKVILDHVDEPRQALLEPNGVGMGPAKYTAHETMKTLLRQYFPPKKKEPVEPSPVQYDDDINNANDEVPPDDAYVNNNDIQEEAPQTISNPEPIEDNEPGDGDGGYDGNGGEGGEGGDDDNNETNDQTKDYTD